MRPWTAGQKRLSLRFSQIAQLTAAISCKHYHMQRGWFESAAKPFPTPPNRLRRAILGPQAREKAIFPAFAGASLEKSA